MSSSIYDISNWLVGQQYYTHDIVFAPEKNKYYYAIVDHVAGDDPDGATFSIDLEKGKWGGADYDDRSFYMPSFIWRPTYSSRVSFKPRILSLKMGDGYEQRLVNGVNNILLELDLVFEKRRLSETTAIIHFLHTRASAEAFLFVPPAPYSKRKKFVCDDGVQENFEFYDNYSISCTFREVVN